MKRKRNFPYTRFVISRVMSEQPEKGIWKLSECEKSHCSWSSRYNRLFRFLEKTTVELTPSIRIEEWNKV